VFNGAYFGEVIVTTNAWRVKGDMDFRMFWNTIWYCVMGESRV